MLSICRAVPQRIRTEPRRITYSKIHVENINYLPTIQYSIRDCKIRQIIALVANRDSRYCGSAIGRTAHTAICGINNLIIRNTEFTIRSVVPFVCFVFNMSVCFSYCCRIGQRSGVRCSPSEMVASNGRVRSTFTSTGVLAPIFSLHMLICGWIKHACTFQYREHPCYTRDLANHSLLSKRLHRIGSRRLYCTTVTVYEEYFISCYLLIYFSDDLSTVSRHHHNHGNWATRINMCLNRIVIQIIWIRDIADFVLE